MTASLIRQQPYDPFLRTQLDSFYAEQRRARAMRDESEEDEPVEEWPSASSAASADYWR